MFKLLKETYKFVHFNGTKSFIRTLHNGKKVVLGIETSCDDTCASIVTEDGQILSHVESSQWSIINKYKGIIPHLCSRMHLVNLPVVLDYVVNKSSLTNGFEDIDAISVTVGPGLDPCLCIGLKQAKELCIKYNKPLIPIHHMEGHAMISTFPKSINFDSFCLLLSGGHTSIYLLNYNKNNNINSMQYDDNYYYDIDLYRGPNHYRLIGETIDDAMGECYDKIARLLAGIDKRTIPLYNPHKTYDYQPITFDEIEHPNNNIPINGSNIEIWAKEYENYILKNPNYIPKDYSTPCYKIPMRQRQDLNFSFCGLKTAVTRDIMKYNIPLSDFHRNHISYEFQRVSTQHIIDRMILLYKEYPSIHHLMLGGGVACNKYLQQQLSIFCQKNNILLHIPNKDYCRDNAVMIAWTGLYKLNHNLYIPSKFLDTVDFDSSLELL